MAKLWYKTMKKPTLGYYGLWAVGHPPLLDGVAWLVLEIKIKQ